MQTKNKYLIAILVVIIILIISFGLFFSIKKLRSTNSNLTLVPEIKKEEVSKDQQFVNLYNQGNFKELNAQLDQDLSKKPNDFTLLLQKANTLAQEASLTFKEKELGDKALVYVDKALAINPNSVEALTLKGYVYEIQQNYVNAHKYYDEALKIDPNSLDTLAQKGHAYDLQGKISESDRLYRRALEINPNDENILSGYARIIFVSNPEESKKVFQKLSKSQNARIKAESLHSLGQLAQKEKYSAEAKKYFTDSTKSDPTFATPHIGIALENTKYATEVSDNSEKNNLIRGALRELDTAIKLNPNLSAAYVQKAVIFASLGRVSESKKILNYLVKEGVDKDITLNIIDKQKTKDFSKALLSSVK